ncbi:MAG: serine hydrolase domain-containing protein [Mucilaginibacter sp.]
MKKLILLAVLAFSVTAQAQDTRARLEKLINGPDGFKAKRPSAGLSIGVIRGDSVYYFAVGSTASGPPINEQTVFEIGSLTKPFTGLLLALEIVKKHIGKNDFIDAWLPMGVRLKPGIRHQVKMTDLGSHQSGLPNFNDDQYIMDMFKKNPEQPFSSVSKAYLYEVLGKTNQLTRHGSYSYSNYAFALLGQLLANSTHQSYAALLRRSVLKPLQLKNTSLNVVPGIQTAGRYDDKDAIKPGMIINATTPAGGLHSNAADMISFLKTQINPPKNQLGRAIKLSQEIFYQDKDQGVGLGWEMQNGLIEKTGDTWGNSSMLSFDPARRIGMVVLCDHRDSQLVQDITAAFWKQLK